MKEINELTRRLLVEGWKPEDTPPGTHPYEEYYGGWTYTSDAICGTVWETPCGLIVNGSHFLNGYMSFNGVDWRVENGNPVVCCPVFPSEPCPLRDPLLASQRFTGGSGDMVFQCACRRTERSYTYEGSLDEAHDLVWKEAEDLWEVFKARHKGRVCHHQSRYGRTAKAWRTFYHPMSCTDMNCTYCDVLAKEIDPRRENVFYDLRRSWTVKGVGLFPDQRKTVVEKGCKLLSQTTSLTICEAIIKYGRREIEYRIRSKYHRDLFFDKSLEIEVLNLRAARVVTRDIAQDLQDVANGIEVTHTADNLKAAKEQKRARRRAAKEQRVRKVEKMILTHGWEALEDVWKRRAEKLLDDDRISELMQCHASGLLTPAQILMPQLSIFPEDGIQRGGETPMQRKPQPVVHQQISIGDNGPGTGGQLQVHSGKVGPGH